MEKWCQTASWLETGPEKRTVKIERFPLFHGVHESNVWQHRKREQGWAGRTIWVVFFLRGSCSNHYSLRSKLFQIHQKTLQIFFTVLNSPNTNIEKWIDFALSTENIESFSLFLFKRLYSLLVNSYCLIISFFLFFCRIILHSYIVQGEPVPLVLGTG